MKKISKINTNNVDPAYWERILSSFGLGVDQHITDNTDDPSTSVVMRDRGKGGHREDDAAFLRTIVDGNDRFMNAHEIKKSRTFYENRVIPEWSQSDARIREILLSAFPKLTTSAAQRRRAGRWMKFIYFYYRLKMPHQVILKEMGLTIPALESLVRTLSRASRGLTWNGKKRKALGVVHPTRELRKGVNEPS